ncbi:MAG: hypothetical protein M3P98_00120 [bacterium]|nr:hypothetical protein [bacterium]
MTNTIKRISLAIILTLVLMLGVTTLAHAQTSKDAACEGIAIAGGDCSVDAEAGITSVIATALNLFSFVVGIAAVIMIIIGGFKYITSGGDSAGTQSAKNTVLFAVIGLIIVALAQIIVIFVINRIK